MIDAILVHPGAAKEIYGDLAKHSAAEPPLWCRLIGGYLMDRGYLIKIVDAEAEWLSANDVADFVLKNTARLVVLVVYGHQPSASTQQMIGARKAIKAIKSAIPNQKILLVGNHCSALPVKTLSEEQADYVCDGEGPVTVDGLLSNQPLESILGLVWRDGDNIRQNSVAPLLDLDKDLHGQVWGLLPMSTYRCHHWQAFDGTPRQPYAAIYTSLGCSFKCSFCMINIFQHTNHYRMRSPKAVAAEISNLVSQYGVTTFKIIDEMFVLNRQHVWQICNHLIDMKLGDHLNMWAYARIDTVKDTQLLDHMRRAGFKWLGIGIESASKHVRDGVGKGRFGNEQIIEAINRVRSVGFHIGGNFIFGLPDDTLESMQETYNLMCEINAEYTNIYCCMAYPGSPLHTTAKEKGWLLPENTDAGWAGYSQHNYETLPLPTETLIAAQVLAFRDEAFMKFHQRPEYLNMLQATFGDQAVADMKAILSHGKPKRKLLGDTQT